MALHASGKSNTAWRCAIAGYPYTNQVTDDNAKKAIIAAFDRISVLTAAQDSLQTSFNALSTVTVVTNPTTGVVTPLPPSGGSSVGSFSTGDLIVADTPSTLIGLPDLPAGNVLLAGGSGVRPFYGKVGLTTHVSGTLPVGNGGTNSATALSGSTIMISNGSAIVQGAAGSTTTVLHGNAGGAPTYGAVSLTADVSGDLPFANLVPATAISVLIGRGAAAGAGDFQEITLGANLTMTGTVLSATGGSGSPGGLTTQVQFNLVGAFAGDTDFTFVTDTLTVTKAVMPTSVSTPSLISTGAIGITPAAGSNLLVTLTTGRAEVNAGANEGRLKIFGDNPVLTLTGDANTGVNDYYFSARGGSGASTGRLGIGVLPSYDGALAATDLFVMTNAGKVGIGAGNAPAYLLTLSGNPSLLSSITTPLFVASPTTNSDVGFSVLNQSTGTLAESRISVEDNSDNYLVMTAPGSGNTSAALFGVTRNVGNFLFSVGASKTLAIGNFSAADFVLGTSNTERLRFISAGTMVVNETGADYDVRMEGDTEVNLFFLDASTDRIGIGTSTVPSLLTVNGLINTKNYTVATLPAGTRGDIAYVTDALAPAFLAVVVGGGAVVAPVFYNGANWVGF